MIRGREGVREAFERNLRASIQMDETVINAILACFDVSVKEVGARLFVERMRYKFRSP